jgi:hypothetical protein
MNRMQLRSTRRIAIVLLSAAGSAIVSCSDPTPVKSARLAEKPAATGSEANCIVWSHDDSLAMEVVHMAWGYYSQGHHDKALVLYKHVCTMKHDLPGLFLYTGLMHLSDKDTLSARKYFLLELKHDQRILNSDLPDCRKYEFRKVLKETRELL